MSEVSAEKESNQHSWLALFSLIFAGEMIFSLPFHVARFFRPSLLEAFQLTNTQIGDAFAVYGITAMISYFPGGLIADHYSARKLLVFSLLATALGGLYYAQVPSGLGLYILFGYWGVTSVLMFWSGMLKAIHDWGGRLKQGRAFGLLDGGRGLVAALMSTIAVFLFAQIIDNKTDTTHIASLQMVIYFYSVVTTNAALLIWNTIPDTEHTQSTKSNDLNDVLNVIKSTPIWLQSIIIVCAYCAYKGLDNYGLYAEQVLSMDTVDAAVFTSFGAYLRPVGAIIAGFTADKFKASSVIGVNFLVLVVIYLVLSSSWSESHFYIIALFNLIVSYLAVFALRGVYFALVEESRIGHHVTGTAIGFVSLIGYTPDIFFPSFTGRVLDANLGLVGFQNYFILLALISTIGLISSFILVRINRTKV